MLLTDGRPVIADTGEAVVRITPDASYAYSEERLDDEPSFPMMRTSLGLVDLQVNGFAGVDFNSADLTPERLDRALEAMLATGVSTCLPTIITAARDELVSRFAALDHAVSESRLGQWMVPGYHLEGPFLNPADGFAGCHPPEAMVDASVELIEDIEAGLSRPILLVTLAPERTGALEVIRWASDRGKLVAVGHSAAMGDRLSEAVAAGLSISTHLGNGLPHLLPKLANPVFEQLSEDGLIATFIADGIHVPRPALKAMIRAKGDHRSVLVTDAVAPARAEPGLYRLADMQIELFPDGQVRRPGSSYLAGSSLQLDQAVRNLVLWGIADPRGALRMACANPRRVLAGALAQHGLRLAASLVRWDDKLRIVTAAVGPATIGE